MNEKLEQLRERINEIQDIEHSMALLSWDQETYMPHGAIEDRSSQLSTLSRIAHEKFTCQEIGQLLQDMEGYNDDSNSDDNTCFINVVRRNYNKQIKVPNELVSEFSKITSLGQHAWQQARETNDFATFQPHLEKIVDNRRRYASVFAPFDSIYDPLLDDYEPFLKTADVQQIMNDIRPQQVALIKEISQQDQVDSSFLHLDYDEQKQWDLGVKIITDFGYDWQHGRQDKVAHPFTTTIGLGDVRITTRLMKNDLFSGLASTMHEAGHAMYEQGIDRKFNRTPIGTGASLAVHESQSRLWENLVGRSYAFCQHYYPYIQQQFPQQLSSVSLDQFYRGLNSVQPSLIRVESDEATYNLHIMLRLEVELMLMEDKVKVADLPDIWNSKMEDYLGLVPKNDSEGVLQDVHWSFGLFGYFSTYALGNLVSAQLWEKISQDIPTINDQIAQGQFSELLQWLRQKVHVHGAKYPPQELVKKVTGSTINPDAYIRYLNNKFRNIYGI